jgi:hypothetical protein
MTIQFLDAIEQWRVIFLDNGTGFYIGAIFCII